MAQDHSSYHKESHTSDFLISITKLYFVASSSTRFINKSTRNDYKVVLHEKYMEKHNKICFIKEEKKNRDRME